MARVLEIPFRQIGALVRREVAGGSPAATQALAGGSPAATQADTQITRVMCSEVRADGRRCRYPAEEGAALCKAHAEWKASALGHLPFPDDALGLQRLMARLLGRLLYENLDPRRAQVAADICRTMRRNLAACAWEAEQAERELV